MRVETAEAILISIGICWLNFIACVAYYTYKARKEGDKKWQKDTATTAIRK